MQQTQFSNILHKEVDSKQKCVNEVKRQEKIKNDPYKKGQNQSDNKKDKRSKNKKQKEEDSFHPAIGHIDIRI